MLDSAVTIALILFGVMASFVLLGYIVGTLRAFLDRRRNDESDSS